MIKPTTKQIFLLKVILGVMLGNAAGRTLADSIDSSGRWDGAFIHAFFPLISIIIMQWILLFDYLPKQWVSTGLTGCIIAASVMGAINFYVSEQIFRLIIQELNIFSSLLKGILVSLPQSFTLKNRRGRMWVLANGIGWLFSAALNNLNFYIDVKDYIRGIIYQASFIPLGILLGLYLYSYVYRSNSHEVITDKTD